MEHRLRQTIYPVQRRSHHAIHAERQARCDYVLPPKDEREDMPFAQYYESNDWDASSAILQYDEAVDKLDLHVTLKNPDYKVDGTERQEVESRDDATENGVVFGADLNVTGAFAVTSTGNFIGSADYLTYKRNEYEKRRSRLQQTGTRSAAPHHPIYRESLQ